MSAPAKTGTSFTPGPWQVEQAEDGAVLAIVPSGGRQTVDCNCGECQADAWGGRRYHKIVTCDSHVYGPPLQDARLIAAAPDLYEVVRLVAEHFGGTNALLGAAARAALAKAEGRDQ